MLGLVQVVLIAVVGVTGALALDVVDLPGQLIGTVLTVIAWFVLGYALYASVFAAAASLVSRQEDLGSVLTPTTLLLVVGVIVSIQAAQDPGSTLATVTSFVPGMSPLVMPVRMAAGEAAVWEIALSVALMLVAIGARRPDRWPGVRRGAAAHRQQDQDPRGPPRRARVSGSGGRPGRG